MPKKYPALPLREVVAILNDNNFSKVRQKGSHITFSNGFRTCQIPYRKDVNPYTLKSVIGQTGLTLDDFLKEKKKNKLR